MLEIGSADKPRPKCYFTQASLPTFVDHEQPPTKKLPFSTVIRQKYNHTLDVIIPEARAHAVQQCLDSTLQYAKVNMKLSEIISGDFFNDYIKSGNIIMLSEGQPGIENIFSLHEGILRLEVDKPTYERMGLQGVAVPSEGRKHVKARFAIDLNLRLPSMVRGHKGFERIIWAFKNVLDHSITWLFCSLRSTGKLEGPIQAHYPIVRTVEPHVNQLDHVLVPSIPDNLEQGNDGSATELLEWLTLVCNLSPRVQSGDVLDHYLSRYAVPDLSESPESEELPKPQNLSRVRWHGFVPSTFAYKILLATLKASGDTWFAFCSTSFQGEAYSVLKANGQTYTWEYKD